MRRMQPLLRKPCQTHVGGGRGYGNGVSNCYDDRCRSVHRTGINNSGKMCSNGICIFSKAFVATVQFPRLDVYILACKLQLQNNYNIHITLNGVRNNFALYFVKYPAHKHIKIHVSYSDDISPCIFHTTYRSCEPFLMTRHVK
jgi:hypothetical protein